MLEVGQTSSPLLLPLLRTGRRNHMLWRAQQQAASGAAPMAVSLEVCRVVPTCMVAEAVKRRSDTCRLCNAGYVHMLTIQSAYNHCMPLCWTCRAPAINKRRLGWARRGIGICKTVDEGQQLSLQLRVVRLVCAVEPCHGLQQFCLEHIRGGGARSTCSNTARSPLGTA